jgi:hypothetical protein
VGPDWRTACSGDRPNTATFKARVDAADHRADFERELADRLMTEWRPIACALIGAAIDW